ncbi:hypothetical protein BPOR_1281g00020 [Botrytis porri]|uniref:Uncharacterized protein n=1 Tax=Botrytis porri TaxID=87229 RepID=A0A4Z1KAL9_9HELO|nr:hypothetical protein BPOR_1281g00020 [Botrytis porri]
MSSTNSNHLPEILTPVSTSNSQDNFAQSKEDFDVSSIPDSDSEGGVSIYYQTPEKEKRRGGDGFADQQMRDDEIIYGDFILDSERNDGDEGYEDNTIAWPTIISSRFSTPTTDELIKYINDTDLLGVDDDGSGEESMTTYHRKLEELARIRKIVARNLIPGTHQTAENSTSTLGKPPTLTGIQKPTPNLSLGTPLIQDFAIPLPASLPTPLPRTIFENLSAIRAPHFPHYLASQTSSLSTYPSPDIGTMYHYYGFSHRRTVNEIDILAPSDDDDDDNDEEEEKDEEEQQDELCRELSEGEEGDDEGDVDLDMDMSRSTPPRPPVLGDRDQNMEDGVEIEDIDGLENGNEGVFQILPHHCRELQQIKENHLQDTKIHPSPILTTNLPPPIHLTIPITIHRHHPQSPHINPWPIIALTYQIPLFPTHILTSFSLAQLPLHEKHLQELNGYSDSPLDQWALTQHRLFLWINSGALENGIDGDMERPGSADILLGEESSEIWDYEDVEVFARWEGGCFRRCLEWVQDVDGGEEREVWEELGLGFQDAVYDFCGEEEILHRSASISGREKENEYSSSSSYLSEEYDASDELGKIVSSIPAPTPPNPRDHRLGRIVNIFRTRALQRLGIPSHDSPFRLRHPVNHLVFRETGIQTADYARANAMARFERVADEFVKGERVGEGVKGGAGEDSAGDVGHLMVGTEGDERFEREEVHMRGGAGAGDF